MAPQEAPHHMTHQQNFELLPLFALDALEGDELDDVEAHLAWCEVCAADLALHQSVTATFTADGPGPAGVWDRIGREIDESQIGEVLGFDAAKAHDRSQSVWFASIAAVVALVFAGLALVQRPTVNELSGPEGVAAAAAAAAVEPGAIVADFETENGAVARLVLTPDGEGFVVPAERLGALSEDRTYQLWVITPDELAISAGVLGNDPEPARFTWTGDVAGFALTRERAGGVASSEGDVVSVIEA